ncbi:OmpW family outer membrane protein [Marinobacteraceae bacterium S3BR75-40.1]
MKKSLYAAAAIPALLSASIAHAYEGGDIIIRNGLTMVEPQEDSSAIDITQPDLGQVPGSAVGVDNDVQIGLSGTYILTPHLGVELLAATPFTHNIYGAGSLSGAGKLGETKHLPPTLSLQYYPLSSSSRFQPYVGVGVNYTMFFEEETTDTLTNSIGALADLATGTSTGVSATSSSLELDDSVGVAVQLGMDYQVTETLGLNAGLWWIDLDTTGTIEAQTNSGLVKADVDVEIDPMVYMVGAMIKF